jgi:hypothetical protein
MAKTKTHDIIIFYQNVRGLRTKCLQLKQQILCNEYDIIVLTETWLHAGILDGEFGDDRYDVFRCDRDLESSGKKTGGGVMIMVHRNLGAVLYTAANSPKPTEMITITIPARTLAARTDLYLSAVYIPPSPERVMYNVENILRSCKTVINSSQKNSLIIIGDFNFPGISWNNNRPVHNNIGSVDVQNAGLLLTNELSYLGLMQYNMYENYAGNILDLAFSSLPLEVNTCISGLVNIDRAHPVLLVKVLDLTVSPLVETSSEQRDFKNCNYDAINNKFHSIDWQSILKSAKAEEVCNSFYDKVNTIIQSHVPIRKKYSSHRYPAWYSTALIKIIKEKSKIHKKWKKSGNLLDYDEFSLLRRRQHRVQEACFLNFTIQAEKAIRNKPKAFWTYIKSLRNSSNYPRQLTYGDSSFTDGRSICNAFNEFFRSVFGMPSTEFLGTDETTVFHDTISKVHITAEMVKRRLIGLDTSKGSGCDGIPPIFWQKCAKTLCIPISIIFNTSLKDCMFPTIWKKAHIVPIHKKGTKTKIENYRGISILNTVSKVFEKIILDVIYPVIYKGLPDTQHGFLRHRSTTSNLACFTNYILCNMEGGKQVDVVYTDFEKAFDRVDHVILLRKLQQLGIHGDLLRWIESYLQNRSQAVVVGGYRSDFINVPTGIPQGSHLGPLLYNAYIYDIATCFTYARHLMYADDKKIFFKVDTEQDCRNIQLDLDRLSQYYAKNKITVNIGKCECISFTRKTNPIIFPYNINGDRIHRTSVVKDLGVYFDDKMLLSNHIDKIIDRGFRNLGFILRSCKPFTDIDTLKLVYYAYVRSIIEYASPIWSPQYTTYKNRLELLQIKFTKHLNYRLHKSNNTSYIETCIEHNLLTLNHRRRLLDVCYLHDIVRGEIDCSELVRNIEYNVPTRRSRRRQQSLLKVPRSKTNYAANALISRLPRVYNDFFNDIDLFAFSKQVFKSKAIEILKST